MQKEMSCRQTISNRLYIRLELVHSLAGHFKTQLNKLNANYLKIPR